MIIRSIRLKDFISHEDTKLNFSPYETTVIVGPNGAGKTSIIDAILYALFGEKVRGDSIKDLIRNDKNSAKVDLIFQENGREYRVIRTREAKGNDARLMEGDNYLAVNREVTSEVMKIIGMDKDIAMSSIFVRQGEISKLLDDQPKERKNLIGRLVGLDKLERSWENVKQVINYFEDNVREYDSLNVELDMLRNERENIKKRMIENVEDKERKKKDLLNKKNEFDTIRNKYERLKQDKERYHDLEASLRDLNNKIEEKANQIKRLEKELNMAENAEKDAERLEKDVSNIEHAERYVKLIRDKDYMEKDEKRLKKELEEIKRLIFDVNETRISHDEFEMLEESKREQSLKKDKLYEDYKQLTKINARIGFLNEELDKKMKEKTNIEFKAINLLLDGSIESKKEKIEELMDILDDIESRLNYIKTKEGEISGRLHEIEEYLKILGDKDECPVCKRPFHTMEEKDRVKKELETEKKQLSTDIGNLKVIKDELIEDRDTANKKLKEIENLEIERIEELKKEIFLKEEELKDLEENKNILKPILIEIEEIDKRLKEIDLRSRYLKNFYDRYNSANISLKRYRSLDEVKADIEQVIQSIAEIDRELLSIVDVIGYRPENGEEELKRLRKSKEEYDRLLSKVQEIPAIIEELSISKDEIKNFIVKSESIKDEIKTLAYSDEEFNSVENIYSEMSRKIFSLEELIKQLDDIYETYFKELDEKNNRIVKIKDKIKEADKLKSFCQDLEKVRTAFSRDGVQKEIRKRIAPLISESALSYLDRFNLTIKDINIDEDFDIELWGQNGKVPIASISGGEKVAVAIAVRLAIANVLSGKISTIIMDEPTIHLDDERRQELAEILGNFSVGMVSKDLEVPPVQLIIVTHHEELEAIADTIYRVEKENGVSYVK